MTTHRLFIALELPEPIKDAVGEVQRSFQNQRLPVRWVAAKAMHLTLVFLGETDATLLPGISQALRDAAGHQQPFELRLDGLGAFPQARRPQVLWAGITGAVEPLRALQHAVAGALEPLGFPREDRPYSAHLTLGRVSRDARPDDRARIGTILRETAPPPPLAWHVERVILFESQLRPGGPEYTARDTIALINARER